MKTALYKLPKQARLCSQKAVAELYASQLMVFVHPIRLKYHLAPSMAGDTARNKVLMAVSKKSYKRSVDRQLLKRRLREGWRLSRPSLSDAVQENYCLHVALMLVGKELYAGKYLQKRVHLVVQKLREQLLASQQTEAGVSSNTAPA